MQYGKNDIDKILRIIYNIIVMKKEYLFLIISILFLSCHKDGKSVINRNNKNISENEIIYGDGFWQRGKNGMKVYEIHDANEFRSKLSFYNYIFVQTGEQKPENMFRLNVSIGSVIFTLNEYLLEYNIFNEILLNNIIGVIFGNIEKDEYFSRVDVFYNDIYYGCFYFYNNYDENIISINYHKAEGINTYFYKRFQINKNNSILFNKDYDPNKMEKMIYLCSLYEYIITGGEKDIDSNILIGLDIDINCLNKIVNEIITSKNYDYINNILENKIKEIFNYNDVVSNILKNTIVEYVNKKK